ncbi:MAG: chromosome partitioning protein ParA [Phycisphaerae bacterium]|nr:chromosome partitioning protein ParA [Phycisphaerae bacterium]
MAVGRQLVTPGHPGRRSRQPLIWTSTSGGRSGRSPYPPEGDWEHQAVEDFCPYTQRMTEVGNTASGPVHLPRSRRVAMLNQKGGVGKTTSTVNLGHGLARAGYRVCLVDLDPQGHLSLHLAIETDQLEATAYQLLVDDDCSIEQVIVPARERLDCIPSTVDLAAAESELADHPDRNSILRHKFAPVSDRYDIILIDCPPGLGLLTLNAMCLVDEIIVPMQAHFLAMQGVGKLMETVWRVSSGVNPDLKLGGILLCMHETQSIHSRNVVSELEAFFEDARQSDSPWSGTRLLHPPIRRNIKLAEAPSFGQTIFDYDPDCRGAKDYQGVVESLLSGWCSNDKSPVVVQADSEADKPAQDQVEQVVSSGLQASVPASKDDESTTGGNSEGAG